MNILLTGGAGYIGSHTTSVLVEKNHSAVIFDNFSNSHPNILFDLENILGRPITFIKGDICDTNLLNDTLHKFKIDAVIHFAGLKSVGESSKVPINYYCNNVNGTLSLLKAMQKNNIKKLVFSSSATVYGNPEYLPLDENHKTKPTNPYGRSKLYIEEILNDLALSDKTWKIICLRYFNPLGAHPSGLIGENPNGIPNNLMPYISLVASKEIPYLGIFGSDYDTHDGTGIRDYIHVMDLAEGHIAALDYLNIHSGWSAINLGTGSGLSVLEIVNNFELVTGKKIPFEFKSRRLGDVAICYADVTKAEKELNWKAKRKISEICESEWNYKKKLIVR